MKIRSARFKNFRTLKDVEIHFDDATSLIGPNGVGKSTILRGLDWFFNSGTKSVLSDSDVNFSAANEEVRVEVTFDDLTDEDREALGSYAPDGLETFTAWKIRRIDGTEALSANTRGFPRFNVIKSATSVAEMKSEYATLQDEDPSLTLPRASTKAQILEAMRVWESENLDRLEDVPEEIATNLFGFNGAGKLSGIFDFVLVTADLRAEEEAVDGRGSIIGRLLERTVDRSSIEEAVRKIVKEAQEKNEETFEEFFGSEIDDLSKKLNAAISKFSSDRKVAITGIPLELKIPPASFSLQVETGGWFTEVERQGHGFQRTLLISALQVLASTGSAGKNGVICLAIEEPELYQHPIQCSAFSRVLSSLAEDPSNHIQVMFATHSSHFIDPEKFSRVRRLSSRAADGNLSVDSCTVESIQASLDGIVKGDVVRRQLGMKITSNLSTALFSKAAIIVEGPSDAAILSGVADRVTPGLLDILGVAVVVGGGKTGIPMVKKTLDAFNIPNFVLFDADANCKESERMNHVKQNLDVQKVCGTSGDEFPESGMYDTFAVFQNNLEDFLENKWEGWSQCCADRERELGFSLSKLSSAYHDVARGVESDPPALLAQVIDKVKSLIS